MVQIHYRTRTINGQELFYREAGDATKPTLLLLHGFPSSSFMFRNLIPLLAKQYHVIAPDHLGFGFSSAPSIDEFEYTFEALTNLTEKLLDELGIESYAMYVQDYGAPIGWRLALRRPDAVRAVISQNGNAYEAGFLVVPDGFLEAVGPYQFDQSPENEAAARRAAFELDAIKAQYTNGVADQSVLDPDTWHHDYALVSRPGNSEAQLKLFVDYVGNVGMYPEIHEYFRTSQVPMLAVWGKGDEVFGPEGAKAFATDLPDAEIHLLEGGHFLLESALEQVAELSLDFLGRKLG